MEIKLNEHLFSQDIYMNSIFDLNLNALPFLDIFVKLEKLW